MIEAFGQDTVPTVFTAEADPTELLQHVSAKHLGYEAVLVLAPTKQRWPSIEKPN